MRREEALVSNFVISWGGKEGEEEKGIREVRKEVEGKRVALAFE